MSYTEMEEVLKFIHKNFAAPHKRLNKAKSIIDKVLERIVEDMKKDAMFDTLYQNYVFPSRLLQVKKPFHFDVKIIFKLPRCREHFGTKNCHECINIQGHPDFPGYVLFEPLYGYAQDIYKTFGSNGFFQTNLAFNWMKSLLYKALNTIQNKGEISSWQEMEEDENEIKFHTEHGSSLVISIRTHGSTKSMYLHISVAFEFDESHWPKNVANPTNQWQFQIIPVSPNEDEFSYWQLDFSSQEKIIIHGKERLKPALRLLKLMKVNLNQKRVPDYALTSLILEVAHDPNIGGKSLSDTFMLVFGKYLVCFYKERVPYFWNKDANLIENMKKDTITNHYNELRNLYNKIDREYKNDPTVVAKVILKGEDYNKFLKIWRNRIPGSLHSSVDDDQGNLGVWRRSESSSTSDDDDEGNLAVWRRPKSSSSSDDDDEGNLAIRDNAATTAAVAVGVLGAFALGATIWNHFSKKRDS